MFDLNHVGSLASPPAIDGREYAQRIEKFWERLADNSVAIIAGNTQQVRTNDVWHPFRQSSDMLYLTGWEHPDAVLVVCKLTGEYARRVLMFGRGGDLLCINTTGRGKVKDPYWARLVDQMLDNRNIERALVRLIGMAGVVYYGFGANDRIDEQIRAIFERPGSPRSCAEKHPGEILHELRVTKSPAEIALLAHATAISAEAFLQAMLHVRPGMLEHQMQAVVEFVFRFYGAAGPAFGTIVAAGNNAAVDLHYSKNDAVIGAQDLVLVDAGAEYGGYAADISRTFPASGRFTPAQRCIYQLVLDAQEAAIRAAKPGARLAVLYQESNRVLQQGLERLGRALGVRLAGASVKRGAPRFPGACIHSAGETAHWLGLDVHDPGHTSVPGQRGTRFLEPGMVLTVEPGLYLDARDESVPADYRGIGVRIEDDILITADGNEVLTAGVPKTIEDIESLMSGARSWGAGGRETDAVLVAAQLAGALETPACLPQEGR
jgi:Xaa-Pro aminopeptidase